MTRILNPSTELDDMDGQDDEIRYPRNDYKRSMDHGTENLCQIGDWFGI